MKGSQRMESSPSNDALLAELDRVVNDTLSFFDGAGRSTSARVDRWQARDVLMHFLYFHDATAWGIQAAATAARGSSHLDKPCFRRANGETITGRQRLEVLARHWAEHVRELQAAAKATR